MYDGIFAANAQQDIPATTVSQFLGIPVHPGEDAAAKQEDDWWRIFNSVVSNTDAIHFVAMKVPPRLQSLEPADLSGFTAVVVPASGDAGYTIGAATAAMEHNRKVRAATAENTRRKISLKDYEQRSAQALATAVDTSLRPKAASLLLRLQSKFKDGTRSTELGTDVHDGHAMVREMRNLRTASASRPARGRSYKWHEEQYRNMLATVLPDGCSSQDYADKCNDLETNHLPYFKTVVLEKDTLSSVYLEFLPANMKVVAGEIEMSMRTAKTFDNPSAVKEAATTRVGMMADPSVEHARLACALGYAPPPPPTSPPPRGSAPPVAAAVPGVDAKAIEKAVVAALAKKGLGGGEDKSNRQKKLAERNQRGRLPDGTRCKSGTCNFDHDVKHPGKPCFSDPRVEIIISHDASQRKGYVDRLRERRTTEAKRIAAESGRPFVEPKAIKVAPAGAPQNPILPAPGPPQSFDGLDDWGQGGTTLGAVAGLSHPLLGDGTAVAPSRVVAGVPVFYSDAELEDALGCPDADDPDDGADGLQSVSDSDGEPDEGTAADIVGWRGPGDEGDVRRHAPDDSQWWFFESPDKQYRGVQRMGHGDWRELDDQDFTLVGFGRTRLSYAGIATPEDAHSHDASKIAKSLRRQNTFFRF